jgi:hypothetical protein
MNFKNQKIKNGEDILLFKTPHPLAKWKFHWIMCPYLLGNIKNNTQTA